MKIVLSIKYNPKNHVIIIESTFSSAFPLCSGGCDVTEFVPFFHVGHNNCTCHHPLTISKIVPCDKWSINDPELSQVQCKMSSNANKTYEYIYLYQDQQLHYVNNVIWQQIIIIVAVIIICYKFSDHLTDWVTISGHSSIL